MWSFGRVAIEKQLAALAAIGIRLNRDVMIDDLLLSFPREDYERTSYDLLLFSLGSEVEAEPWGRHISDDAWNFDLECVEGPGSYGRIVENLLRLAKQPNLITQIVDEITPGAATGELHYTLKDRSRSLEVEIRDDWADGLTVAIIMGEIADAIGDGRTFWGIDNGQASILFFLSDDQAAQLNRLTKNKLKPMSPT